MATIKVKFRQFAESEQGGSVYYRIYHRNQIRQIASGYTMQGDEWQSRNGSKSEKFPPSKPETEIIFRKIEFDKERFIRIITTFETSSRSYTADDIVDEFISYSRQFTLAKFMEQIILKLKQTGKIRTSETYASALRSFTRFCNDETVMIDHIHSDTMELYQVWLEEQGITLNTVSFYARILRAVYNRAVDQGITPDRRPFRHIYTGIDKTVKRALSLPELRKIKNINLDMFPDLDFARDIFLMSFYLRGMSFVDMAFLRKSDLSDGYVTYRRRKTGQLLTIAWTPEMAQILEKYPPNPTSYLLPIIRRAGKNERNMYHNMSYTINRRLKAIANMADIRMPLTLYVARHSWASAAKAKGIPLSVISQWMGHDSESTTQIYLASLDTAVIDNANALIIASL